MQNSNVIFKIKKSSVAIKGSLFAALVMAGVSAHAASNAHTTITADIVNATCELEATPSVDLGNWTSEGKKAGAMWAETTKDIIVGLSGCKGLESSTAAITVNGQNVPGNDTVFNKDGNPGDVGISLALKGTAIKNHADVPIGKGTAEELNGQKLVLQAGIISLADNPDVQHIEAPINFNFKLN